MNTALDVLLPCPPPELASPSAKADNKAESIPQTVVATSHGTDTYDFAQQQVRGLVQQVFFPGWPRPARQVVFSGVDQETDTAAVCAQVCQAMAHQLPGRVCAVEANLRAPALEQAMGNNGHSAGQESALPPKHGLQLDERLWLLPRRAFLAGNGTHLSATWLRTRLSELRREFDYTLIHAPAAGLFSETALIGQLADGVILVLDAHTTRRAAARKTQQTLLAANARLLGIVLKDRTFPIPEGIYRRL